YMTIGDYILLALAIIIPTILYILSLVLFYSHLFKATLPTLFALILTIGSVFFLTILIPRTGLIWLNPFQYVIAMDAILFQNDRVWYQGIPVLLILTVVFYSLSLQKIKTSKLN